MIEIIRQRVLADQYFLATRKPIAVAIAGDSGAGKDTLAISLGQLFGANRSVQLSGDDYHVWDRRKPSWRAFTHLNPAANFLGAFFRDIESLLEQNPVLKRKYDHSSGKMTRPLPLKPKDVLIISGLHALLNIRLNQEFDAKVFLAMDDRTRKALKIRRDVQRRGYSLDDARSALKGREADSEKFILPQQSVANVVFRLAAQRRGDLARAESGLGEPEEALDMILMLGTQDSEHANELKRILGSVLGVNVYTQKPTASTTWLRVEQNIEVSSDAIAAASSNLMPSLKEFVSLEPVWSGGVLGIMQLVVMSQIMRNRNIH